MALDVTKTIRTHHDAQSNVKVLLEIVFHVVLGARGVLIKEQCIRGYMRKFQLTRN